MWCERVGLCGESSLVTVRVQLHSSWCVMTGVQGEKCTRAWQQCVNGRQTGVRAAGDQTGRHVV